MDQGIGIEDGGVGMSSEGLVRSQGMVTVLW